MSGIYISSLPLAPAAELTDVFAVDQGAGPTTYKETNQQILTLFKANGEALTKVDDTNVTLTLGGTPATSLLNATSITAGWTGQLGLTRGGTNSSLTASNGGIVYSDASALQILSGTATAGQIIRSGASGAPSWSTTTYPATNAINTIMYASSANVLGSIAAANSSVLVTSAGGVPSLSTTLPSGLAATNMNLTTPTLGVASATSINFGGSTLNTYVSKGSFTPTMTFATVGDLSVSYAIQTGFYWQIGEMVFMSFTIRFTPTYTTASGNVIFGGLTVAGSTTATVRLNAVIAESTTWPTSCTQIYASFITASPTTMNLFGEGSGTAAANFTTTHFTSGVQRTITISGVYGTN